MQGRTRLCLPPHTCRREARSNGALSTSKATFSGPLPASGAGFVATARDCRAWSLGPGGSLTSADALFTGRVREARSLSNAVTGARFHWMLVDTLRLTIDVVADPEVLCELPAPGSIVSGSLWLSGRILDVHGPLSV